MLVRHSWMTRKMVISRSCERRPNFGSISSSTSILLRSAKPSINQRSAEAVQPRRVKAGAAGMKPSSARRTIAAEIRDFGECLSKNPHPGFQHPSPAAGKVICSAATICPGAVVQLAGDPAPFRILRVQEPAGDFSNFLGFLKFFAIGDVGVSADHTNRGPSESRTIRP